MAIEAFRRIQIGKESTPGTAVAATRKLIGELSISPNLTIHRPTDERNSLSEFRRSEVVGQDASLSYSSDATYDQIIHFLAMALKGGVTPTQPDVGNSPTVYDWVYTPVATVLAAVDTFTIEYGDNTQEFECKYCFVQSLELGFAMNSVVTLKADMMGHYPIKSSFTGALSDESVEEVVSNDLTVAIDTTWANLGVTPKSGVVAGATLRIPTGLVPIKAADGSMEFTRIGEQRRHFELDLDILVSSAAITEYDAAVAQTDRAIRLIVTGPTISDDETYMLTIDFFGRYTAAPTIWDSQDGENLIRLSLVSHADASGNELSITVRNIESAY